jgi:hypothetical protein
VGVSPLQLVNLYRNRRYFVIKLHTWFCLSYFLKTNINLLHLSIFYEYQQIFQHRICFSIQPPDYSDPWPVTQINTFFTSFFLIMLFKNQCNYNYDWYNFIVTQTVMIFMIHIWLSFGINILQECACISLTMKFGIRDTYLPDNTFINKTIPTLYHCIDTCYRFNLCKSINFLRSARHCMLNNADTVTVATVTKVGSFYMERDQFPNVS